MLVSKIANRFRVFLISQFFHVNHVPMILIAIREPILRWYLLSSVLTYRGNYSSVFHCL